MGPVSMSRTEKMNQTVRTSSLIYQLSFVPVVAFQVLHVFVSGCNCFLTQCFSLQLIPHSDALNGAANLLVRTVRILHFPSLVKF